MSASGIYISVTQAGNKDILVGSVPGCGDPEEVVFHYPDSGGDYYDSVTVSWGKPCVDPGETAVFKFGVGGPNPGGSGIIHDHEWLFPLAPCPPATPTPIPTPTPTPFFFPETVLFACNDTGMPANALQVSVDSAANFTPLQMNAPGCPDPEITFIPPEPSPLYQGVILNWGELCVDPGEAVVLVFGSDCPGCAATVNSHTWLIEPTATPTPPLAYQGDVDCNKTVDSVDALGVLRDAAGFDQPQCIVQGDVDCDEDRDSVDALGILRYVAALPPLEQNEPCAEIGTPI